MQHWNLKLCVFLATSYQDTGQKQQVSKAESIKMHVTQFKSVQIRLKKWKLAVSFFICSWPQKGMKIYRWHRTGVRMGHPIWFLRITHFWLPSHQTRFDLPTKNGFQWTFEIAQSLVRIFFTQNSNLFRLWRSRVFRICTDLRTLFCLFGLCCK